MRSWWTVIPLLFLLALAIYIAGTAWIRFDYDIPFVGWLALIGGAVTAMLLGGGLMALLFYSNRHGYDDLSGGDGAKDQPPPPASWRRTDSD
ncbi:MAG TPA: hypothetical protein VE224_09085 [Pseudolabrys sp.]|nr:hypothetical protein [Pseudolabrys sp.]